MKGRAGRAAFVCVTYHRPAKLIALIESIVTAGDDAEIIVVNNARMPLDMGLPREHCTVLECGSGINVSAARNMGWRATQLDTIIFIDDDNRIVPGLTAALNEALSDPSVGVAAPHIVSADESPKVLCYGTARSMYTTRTVGVVPDNAEDEWDIRDMPSCYGIRRQTLVDVGGFDALRFPLHYEEADLHERIRRRGLRIVGVPKAAVVHDNPVRTMRDEVLRLVETHQLERLMLQIRARFWFHQMYGRTWPERILGGMVAPTVYACIVSGIVLARSNLPLKNRAGGLKAVMKGVASGVGDGPIGITCPLR